MESIQKIKNLENYEINEELGRGTFGIIYRISKGKEQFALKMIEKDLIKEYKMEQYIENEASIMKKINSENVIKIYDFFQNKDFYFMILEYCPDGNLLDYVNTHRPDLEEAIQIFIQIANGIRDIHSLKAIHRDLKPDNILKVGKTFKIADFGLAKPDINAETYCGTTSFMAPEILDHQSYDYKSDIWSLGIIFPDFFDLISKIFVVNPKKRIEFSLIWEHKIVKKYCSSEILQKGIKQYKEIENDKKLIKWQTLGDIQVKDCKNEDKGDLIIDNNKIKTKYQLEQEEKNQLLQNDLKSPQIEIQIYNISNLQVQQNEKIDESNFISDIENQDTQQFDENENEENINDEDEESLQQFNNYLKTNCNFYHKKPSSQICELGPKFKVEYGKQQLFYHKISGDENENDNDLESNKMQTITKMQSPLTSQSVRSILKKFANCQSNQLYDEYLLKYFEKLFTINYEFTPQIKLIKFEMEKCAFISEYINSLSQLKLTINYKAILNFTVTRLVLAQINQLFRIFINKENILNMDNFKQFLESKAALILTQKVLIDKRKWISKRNLYFYNIDINLIENQDQIKEFVQEEYKNFESFADIKIGYRSILDQVIRNCLIVYQQCVDDEEKKLVLRIAMHTLLMILINKIDKQNIHLIYQEFISQKEKSEQFEFYYLKNFLNDLSLKQLKSHLFAIIQRSFGQNKLESFKKILKNNSK